MAADANAGKLVYVEECQDCHGATGTPSKKLQKNLNITMKNLAGTDVQGLSDAELKKRSVAGTGKMKPVQITGKAVDDLIAYVRTFAK